MRRGVFASHLVNDLAAVLTMHLEFLSQLSNAGHGLLHAK